MCVSQRLHAFLMLLLQLFCLVFFSILVCLFFYLILIILDACLYSNENEKKKDVDFWGWWRTEEDLGRDGEGKS